MRDKKTEEKLKRGTEVAEAKCEAEKEASGEVNLPSALFR